MRRLLAIFGCLFLLLLPPAARAGTVKRLNLADGQNDRNKIQSPIYDSTSLASVTVGSIRSEYDRKGEIIRQLSKGWFTRGVKADLDPSIDLGALLAEAMRQQSVAMGFQTAGVESSGWNVSGGLSDIVLESRQVPYGPTIFWAFMSVSIDVARGPEAPQNFSFHLANMYGRFNAGFSRKDEAQEAMVEFLVESAQEIMARLNRRVFHGRPSPALRKSLDALVARGASSHEIDARIVGLAGDSESAQVLLDLLAKENGEGNRSNLIDALANIGSQNIFETLTRRYAGEDAACRYYILKAMDHLGGDAAAAFVKDRGSQDDDHACRSLAARLGGKNPNP